VCDTTAVCGSTNAEAYLIYYNGDQWVAWVDCGFNNSIDDCEVLPRTEVGGVPETEGLYLRGGPGEDTISLTNGSAGGPYELQPVPGHGDTIRAYAYGDGDTDRIYGSMTASFYQEFLYGGDGGDLMYGKSGDDFLFGGAGQDWIEGGWGNDTIYSGADGGTLIGGDDDDTIYGGDGAEKIAGGRGADKIDPGAGNDLVCGDEHVITSGTLSACAAEDPIHDGADHVRGSVGNDAIWTQDGNDKVCDSDADTIDAGSGQDQVYHDGSYASLTCGGGADTSNVNVASCEPPPTQNACTVLSTW